MTPVLSFVDVHQVMNSRYNGCRYNCNINKIPDMLQEEAVLTLKALGFFLPVQHWGGGVFHPLCKIRSRHPRKLKFTGLIAYAMFYKICKFESLTIINDVITKNDGKMWYLTLTFIKFDPDGQKI